MSDRNIERTFAYIKPDAMEARLAGRVLTRIEQEGFDVELLALAQLDAFHVDELYAEHVGKPFYEELRAFTVSRPVVLLVLARESAVAHWRAVLGPTDPRMADGLEGFPMLVGAQRSLRGLYGNKAGAICRNVAHGSATAKDAAREIALVEKWLGDCRGMRP
jgi:nucleoside-diphosphate kinase